MKQKSPSTDNTEHRGLEQENWVIENLSDSAPIITLVFEEKGDIGVLFGTKQKDRTERFVPVVVSREIDTLDEEGEENECRDKKEHVGFVLTGIGNYGELMKLSRLLRRLTEDRLMNCGYHLGFHNRVLDDFIDALIANNRSIRLKPYCVELSLLCIVPDIMSRRNIKQGGRKRIVMGKTLDLYRIKYNGDYQPVLPFSIIGGYRKIDGVSLRRHALELFRATYKKGYPTLRIVKKIMEEVLKDEEGELRENIFNPLNSKS